MYELSILTPRAHPRMLSRSQAFAAAFSAKKALLNVNATVNAVSLVADGGAIEVIRPTRFGAANIRAVNPIKAEFSVVQVPSQTVLGTFDVSMSRGEDLSFIVTNDGVELVPTSYGAVITD